MAHGVKIFIAAVILLAGVGLADNQQKLSPKAKEYLEKLDAEGKAKREESRLRLEKRSKELVAKQKENQKGHKRRQIRRDLVSAFVSWAKSGKVSDGEKCDQLIDAVMEMEEPSARHYFNASQFSNLRWNPYKAISILKKANEKIPEETASCVNLPVRIAGPLWIGTFQRQTGDAQAAMKTYETVRSSLSPDDKEGCFVMRLCSLYMAEIASENLKDEDRSLQELNAIEVIPEHYKELPLFHTILLDWAAFKRTGKSKSQTEALKNLTLDSSGYGSHLYFAMTIMKLSGLTPDTMLSTKQMDVIQKSIVDRVNEMSTGTMDKSILEFYCGYDSYTRKNYSESDKHYKVLFESKSFFSPLAGLSLAESKNEQRKHDEADRILEKVKIQYPGYKKAASEKKEKWDKFRTKEYEEHGQGTTRNN